MPSKQIKALHLLVVYSFIYFIYSFLIEVLLSFSIDRFFKKHPQHQQSFKAFRHAEPDDLHNLPKAANHGRKVMDQIQLMIVHIEEPDALQVSLPNAVIYHLWGPLSELDIKMRPLASILFCNQPVYLVYYRHYVIVLIFALLFFLTFKFVQCVKHYFLVIFSITSQGFEPTTAYRVLDGHPNHSASRSVNANL